MAKKAQEIWVEQFDSIKTELEVDEDGDCWGTRITIEASTQDETVKLIMRPDEVRSLRTLLQK